MPTIHRAAPFVIFCLLQESLRSLADTIYPYESSTNTRYRIDFNTADFPAMREQLNTVCRAIIYTDPVAEYYPVARPQCRFDNTLGPEITLSVEVYHQLTQSFQSCLNDVLTRLCNDYEQSHRPTPDQGPTAGNLAGIIMLSLLGICFISVLCIEISKCINRSAARNPYDYEIHTPLSVPSTTVYVEPPAPSFYYSTWPRRYMPFYNRPHRPAPPFHHTDHHRPSAPPAPSSPAHRGDAHVSVDWKRP